MIEGGGWGQQIGTIEVLLQLSHLKCVPTAVDGQGSSIEIKDKFTHSLFTFLRLAGSSSTTEILWEDYRYCRYLCSLWSHHILNSKLSSQDHVTNLNKVMVGFNPEFKRKLRLKQNKIDNYEKSWVEWIKHRWHSKIGCIYWY